MPDAAAIAWIAGDAHAQCLREAALFYPRETGGTFMGYWSPTDQEVVITRLIPAGPRAFHSRTAFEPDQKWQLTEIARHYRASGRREGYLGDWHSHPGAGSGNLSRTDRSVLRRIIRTPEARTSRPISIVVWGGPRRWETSAWVATLSSRTLLGARLSVLPAAIQLYDAQVRDAPSQFAD